MVKIDWHKSKRIKGKPDTSPDSPRRDYFSWLEHPKLPGVAHIATALGAVCAAIAVGFGAHQLSLSAEQNRAQSLLQREIAANGSWERYMELASAHPELARGRDYTRLRPVEQVRYYWFVERMLFAGEQVLAYDPNDAQWKLTIRVEARPHTTYLGSEDFLRESFCSYTQSLRLTLIEEFTSTNRPVADRLRARDLRCMSEGFNE